MIYERLDKKCHAKIIAITDLGVIIDARWPANYHDRRKFSPSGLTGTISPTHAINHTVVSKDYFEKRYGVKL